MVTNITEDQIRRFRANLRRDSTTGCLLWTAAMSGNGYGNVGFGGRNYGAHRLAWIIEHGDPGALFVLHACDTPLCCEAISPGHLFLGTHQDNMDDARAKGRMVTEPGLTAARAILAANPELHARGDQNGRTKLSIDDVREIRDMYRQGIKASEIGRQYGIARQSVWRIVTGRARDVVTIDA